MNKKFTDSLRSHVLSGNPTDFTDVKKSYLSAKEKAEKSKVLLQATIQTWDEKTALDEANAKMQARLKKEYDSGLREKIQTPLKEFEEMTFDLMHIVRKIERDVVRDGSGKKDESMKRLQTFVDSIQLQKM